MQNVVPKIGRPILQQPMFNWEAKIYIGNPKLHTRGKQYILILQYVANRKNSNLKNWLDRKGLQFLEILT